MFSTLQIVTYKCSFQFDDYEFVQPLCFTVWRETENGEKDIFRQGCSSSVKGLQVMDAGNCIWIYFF